LCLFSSTFVFADDDDDDDDEEVDTVYRLETGMNQLARQEVTTRLEPLGFGLMGDTIDPITGTLMFHHTDVSLPGNSDLEVAIRRMASSGEMTNYQEMFFGDWMLNVPQISRIVSKGKSVHYDSVSTAGGRRQFTALTQVCDLTAPRLGSVGVALSTEHFTGGGAFHIDPELERDYQGETYSDGVKLS